MTAQPPLVEPRAEALSPAEWERYARHLALPEIGDTGQRRLANARVLVVGAGGLGAPILTTLAGAGVGTIGIVDDDAVAVSNLHRQTLYSADEVGRPKAETAARALTALNPLVTVIPIAQRLDATSAGVLFADYDLVVDGTDTFGTHLDIDAAAENRDVPVVWGSALGTDGQVTVFRRGVRLRDLYPEPPLDDAGGCQVAGILGPVCAAVGAVMAMEAVKLIVGAGRPLVGRLLVLDALDQTWREIPFVPAR